MEVLNYFQTLITELFKNLGLDAKSVNFWNNKSDPTTSKEIKDKKEGAK
jgi:hypothetical protein